MNKTFTRRALRTHAAMIPIIGAVRQSSAVVYKLERRDPETGRVKTAWSTFRDRYNVGDVVSWGYGRHWTVVEVRES